MAVRRRDELLYGRPQHKDILRRDLGRPTEAFNMVREASPGQERGVVLYTRNGVPDQFQTQNTPFDYQSSMWQNYFYFQDKWQVTRKLVANLGLRWDRYLSHYPEQGNDGIGAFAVPTHFDKRTLPVFNNWVPRLGIIYDLFGNGNTALKVNYGRYAEDPDITFSQDANPNRTPITNRYAWDGTLPITPALVIDIPAAVDVRPICANSHRSRCPQCHRRSVPDWSRSADRQEFRRVG